MPGEAAPGLADLGRGATAALLVLLLAVVAFAWRGLLDVPFVGEDYTILARVRDGGPAYEHVFRPLSSLWIRALHGAFGADSAAPFHAAVIALQAVNALLVFAVGVGLFARRAPALVAATAYAVGAAATDSLVWTANVTRPLSACALLVAACGLVWWGRTPRRAWLGPALLALGLGVQAFTNEEAYGTALLAVAWLTWRALRPATSGPGAPGLPAERDGRRRAALAGVAVVLAGTVLHFLFLQRAPGGADAILLAGLRAAPASAWERSRDVCAGLGIAFPGSALVPFAFLAPLAAARRIDAALFLFLAWLASFVPFVLDAPVEYRSFPTLAPNALILGGAVHGAVLLLGGGRALERWISLAAALLVLLGSAGPRTAHLVRWRDATREIAAVDALLRERGWSPDDPLPALVNLDSSTVGVLVYRLRVADVYRFRALGFLDGAGGFVAPVADAAELPPEPWIGRRLDDSIGVIDPATYFAGRPALDELRLVGRLHAADGIDAARVLLADPAVDLTDAAVAETDVGALGPLAAGGEVRELEPFAPDPVAITARMVVEVVAPGPAVLAVCPTWQYAHGMRLSRDQTIYSDVTETRILRLQARIDGGEPLQAFPLDLYGFGVPIPAGTHRVELAWRRAAPEELR